MRLALVACGLSAVGAALLIAAGPAYRIGLVSLPNAFVLLRWGAYAGLAALAVAGLAAAFAYRAGTRRCLALSAAAFVAGLVVVGIPFEWQRRARSVPPIHDIATDLENPPTFEAVVPLRADAPNRLERPDDLAKLQRSGYPDLAPITLPLPLDETFDRALRVAQEFGWQIVTADRGSGRIEATDTTRWFGFEDDVVVRLTPWGSGTRVDVRSVSRVGRGDAGTNARRIRRFLNALGSA